MFLVCDKIMCWWRLCWSQVVHKLSLGVTESCYTGLLTVPYDVVDVVNVINVVDVVDIVNVVDVLTKLMLVFHFIYSGGPPWV